MLETMVGDSGELNVDTAFIGGLLETPSNVLGQDAKGSVSEDVPESAAVLRSQSPAFVHPEKLAVHRSIVSDDVFADKARGSPGLEGGSPGMRSAERSIELAMSPAEVTAETSERLPQQEASDVTTMDGLSARLDEERFWIPQATPDGRLFYFNTLSGHSTMETPSALLSAGHEDNASLQSEPLDWPLAREVSLHSIPLDSPRVVITPILTRKDYESGYARSSETGTNQEAGIHTLPSSERVSCEGTERVSGAQGEGNNSLWPEASSVLCSTREGNPIPKKTVDTRNSDRSHNRQTANSPQSTISPSQTTTRRAKSLESVKTRNPVPSYPNADRSRFAVHPKDHKALHPQPLEGSTTSLNISSTSKQDSVDSAEAPGTGPCAKDSGLVHQLSDIAEPVEPSQAIPYRSWASDCVDSEPDVTHSLISLPRCIDDREIGAIVAARAHGNAKWLEDRARDQQRQYEKKRFRLTKFYAEKEVYVNHDHAITQQGEETNPTQRVDEQLFPEDKLNVVKAAGSRYARSDDGGQPQETSLSEPAVTLAAADTPADGRHADDKRKAAVVGDPGCGKSYLLFRFAKGTWPQNTIYLTVFYKYMADVEVDGKHLELALWDTAGMEDYDRLRPLSYPDAHIILLCFNIGSPDSLDNVQDKWIGEVLHFCQGLPIFLVGLQCDLRYDPSAIMELRKTNQRPVTWKQGEDKRKKIGACMYLECSAKTNEGVREVFEQATRAKPRRQGSRPSDERLVLGDSAQINM